MSTATIIAILNPKGGSGKSTLATNVARGLQLLDAGREVLLVDSDPQGTARDWRDAQGEGSDLPTVVGVDRPTLHREVPRVARSFDYIVIDGAARLQEMSVSAIKCADVVLIPVQPSAADIWAAVDLVELVTARQGITDGRPRSAFVVSRQIVGTRLASDAQAALADFGLPIFTARTSQRVAFAEALSKGVSVLDHEPEGKAAQEIRDIVNELVAFCHVEKGEYAHR